MYKQQVNRDKLWDKKNFFNPKESKKAVGNIKQED